MSSPFAEHMLLQSETIPGPRSMFQEAVREFPIPRTHAPLVGNNFRSQFYIPRGCARVFRSSISSLVGPFLLDWVLLLVLLIPSPT
jgi:hypothetical protein